MWPLAKLFKSDPLALKLAKEEAAASAATTAAKPAAKPPRKPLSAYAFSPDSAQNAVSRLVADGIVLPVETRKTLARCFQIAMLNYEPNRKERGQAKTVVRI